MAYEYIIAERLDGCAIVTLNRPEKLNALSFPLMTAVRVVRVADGETKASPFAW